MDLLEAIAAWCSRPGMFLVGWPESDRVDVSYLFAYINGYIFAANTLPLSTSLTRRYSELIEHAYRRRPSLRSRHIWFGNALADELGGDHRAACEQILAWVREVQSGL